MSSDITPLTIAKQRIDIPCLAALRGWDWSPGARCAVPYREDRTSSGSVFADGRLFRDFSSGETMDAPALLARVENISNADACKLLIELAEVRRDELPPPAVRPPEKARVKKNPVLPELRTPSRKDLAQIAKIRGLSFEGVEFAANLEFLFTARFNDHACWALTDSSRRLCQLRRLDGEPFAAHGGGHYKAHTCRGSWGGWPIGCSEAARVLSIALVEGGGDFLAACHFIVEQGSKATVAPVGMLGAANKIPPEAMEFFRGKRVRIFAHIDPPQPDGKRPGYEAAAKWEAQLSKVNAMVTTYDLSGLMQKSGVPVEDLNDVARMNTEDFEADPDLSLLMIF